MNNQLTIIVPTLNESGNIKKLVNNIKLCINKKFTWEIIFIDDESTDGTQQVIEELLKQEPNISVIYRKNKKGLSSACIEGFQASHSELVAVMDADLQHDETLLVDMFETLKDRNIDLVIGSRFLKDSDKGNFSRIRTLVSVTGNTLSRLLIQEKVTDPLSGFFMIRKNILDEIQGKYYGQGFKILLDIFCHSKKLHYKELPFIFGTRQSGESKLNSTVMLEFLGLFLHKFFGRVIPVQFIIFCIIGLSGVLVHFFILMLIFRVMNNPFFVSQTIAILSAMTSNFYMNNIFNYKDSTLYGSPMLKGLVLFYLTCSLGATINLGISEFLYEANLNWVLSALVGILSGTFFNYTLSSKIIWKTR